jgi:CBS domain containing-hemolysin-like protein
MFTILILTVTFSITISAFCSLMEATLYSVPLAYVRHLAEAGSKRAKILYRLKQDIGKPIAAILILNTISNTGGAAIAGAAVADL